MSTQQKASGGGRKTKSSSGAGGGVAVSENNNNNAQISNKKHNINAKDAVNNNTDQSSKTEKEKPHVKVSNSYFIRSLVPH